MRILATILIVAAWAGAASAADVPPPPDVAQLLAKEDMLNDRCRGGSGDDPATAQACAGRDEVFDQITAKGWCYGEANQPEYQKKWHKCAANLKKTRPVVARAVGPTPGAILCADYQTVSVLLHLYSLHWEQSAQDTYSNGQSQLVRGKAMPAPDPAEFGCILVEPGTTMQLETGNTVPIVDVQLPSGKTARGVTLPTMFANK
jgi:hypothetical protein